MAKQDKPDIPDSAEEEVFLYNLLQKMGCDGEEAIILTGIVGRSSGRAKMGAM